MDIRDVAEDDVILLVGSPRSGTTWLAKIFDSHPDVLYRHEPDKILRDPLMQRSFQRSELSQHRAAARSHVRKLIGANYLKTVGVLPIFPKSYQSGGAYCLRLSWLLLLSCMARMGLGRRSATLGVPDMVSRDRSQRVRLVIKSIASHGRVGLLASAMPGSKIVYIIRDPLGHVASMRRGIELGKFEKRIPLDECLGTEQAAAYGLTREVFERLPLIEQITWHWALRNEKTLDDLAGNANARIVSYDDLCAEPTKQAQALFEFVGLSWHPRTEAFIHASTTSKAPEGYYRIYKNTTENLHRWRRYLNRDEQARIEAIVRKTRMAKYCPSLSAGPEAVVFRPPANAGA